MRLNHEEQRVCAGSVSNANLVYLLFWQAVKLRTLDLLPAPLELQQLRRQYQ